MSLLLFCLTLILTPPHVKRILDGDTFALYHVGVPAEERVRVLEINTPERGQPGFDAARSFTATWLAQGEFTITVCKRDSFGRMLATVTRGPDTLAVALINAGLGVRP